MMSVLIVEDDLSIADMLQETLESQGFLVTGIARTVEDAIQAIERREPGFAIIDVHLAKGGLGIEVAAYLRDNTKTVILFSTGNDDRKGLTPLIGDAVMTKPYRLSDIGRGLNILCEIRDCGKSALPWPRNFRVLAPVAA
jgi:DNA-binding response OmpR family regulator